MLVQGDNGVEEKHGPMVLGPVAADELRQMIVAVVTVVCDVLDRADIRFAAAADDNGTKH